MTSKSEMTCTAFLGFDVYQWKVPYVSDSVSAWILYEYKLWGRVGGGSYLLLGRIRRHVPEEKGVFPVRTTGGDLSRMTAWSWSEKQCGSLFLVIPLETLGFHGPEPHWTHTHIHEEEAWLQVSNFQYDPVNCFKTFLETCKSFMFVTLDLIRDFL